MQNNLEKELRRALKEKTGEPEAGRMALTTEMLHNAYKNRGLGERIGFGGFLLRQIRFSGWKIWLLQAVLMGLLRLVLAFTYGSLDAVNQDKIPLLLCCVSVIIVMSAAPFLWRSLRYRMFETEIASRMSVGRLIGAWLLLAGLGDGLMLSGVFFYTVRSTSISHSGAALYLLAPFLLAMAGLSYLLGHVRPERFLADSTGMGAVLLLVFTLLSEYCPAVFRQTFSLGWGGICLCLLAFGVRQCWFIQRKYAFCGMEL